MESNIETQVIQREKQFIETAQEILSKEHTDRIKIKLLYEEYISCTVAVNQIIANSIKK